MSAPSSPRRAARAFPLLVLALLLAVFATAAVPALGEDGEEPAVAEGAADLFYVSPAEAAALRAQQTKPAPVAAPHDQLVINVLSNRADLISGGDALVEVVLPDDVAADNVRVSVDGRDVTSSFAVRADGRYYGLVTDLAVGANEVLARVVPAPGSGRPAGRTSARITITNHPASGPVFSGAQMQPWVCATPTPTVVQVTIPGTTLTAPVTTRPSGLDLAPTDASCEAPRKFTFYYEPKSREATNCTFTNTGTTRCFEPYNLATPPADADIADFTNDRGDTVKSIVRVERGTIDRGIYELVTFYDPATASTPWSPPAGWNEKLVWRFGASSAVHRFQTPTTTSVWDNTALRRGFMVASSSLTDHGVNANDTLGAEAMMMVKERIAETYGPIRYTIGVGCSGGSIFQLNIAAAYPGLLNGIQPNCTYPDTLTTAIEVQDCGLLQQNYYATPAGSALTLAQRAAIDGHNNVGFCDAWVRAFVPAGNPSLAGNCGSGWPSALTFDLLLRPQGIRCNVIEHDAMMFGTTTGADGITRANSPLDNVGVQYGLRALADGVVTPEQFVQLNEGVGGYDADFRWGTTIPRPRTAASAFALRTAYTAGIASDGRQLAKTAIIDQRGNQTASGDIHMNWRAWEVRERLDKANGNHDNQVIWAFVAPGGGAGQPGTNLGVLSFETMDKWLHNVELDTSVRTTEQKIAANKPAAAIDRCLATSGATDAQIAADLGLGSAACPVKFQSSPRQVAGGPLAENVFKCRLKPLDFASADYAGITFTAEQQARLAAVFGTGVCDWSQPGVEQQPADGWTTFEAGPGGQPLGPAPVSRGGCPGNAEGNGNAPAGQCPGRSAGPGR